MTDIFQEVEEDVRREQAEKLMRRYGPYALAGMLVIVLAVGGYQFYKGRHAEAIARAATAYDTAAGRLESDPKAAAAAFAALAAKGGGFGLLSRFRQAEAEAAAGNVKGASGVLDGIAQDPGVDPLLRDLARLKAGYLLLDSVSLAELERRLGPLASGTTIWRYDAQSLIAFAALREGERARAQASFKALADDPAAPPGVRERASDMVLALGESPAAAGAGGPAAPKSGAAPPAPSGTTN